MYYPHICFTSFWRRFAETAIISLEKWPESIEEIRGDDESTQNICRKITGAIAQWYHIELTSGGRGFDSRQGH